LATLAASGDEQPRELIDARRRGAQMPLLIVPPPKYRPPR
jgi:hypothetical protein